MWIKSIELFQIRMPLNFTFKTSKTSFNYRETIVIKAVDELGNIGYGEVVAFNEPFYSNELLTDSKRALINIYIPKLFYREIKHPFELHKWIGLTYPMAIAGLENALLDLFARRQQQPIMDVVFDEATHDMIAAGIVLGDSDISSLMRQIEHYQKEGYTRFKIKIKPEDGFSKLKLIKERYPDIKLLADANRSYKLQEINELKKLDQLHLLCIEEPLASMGFHAYKKIQEEMKVPICLDESIQTMEDLKTAIQLEACKVVNIKIGRIGGMYYAKKMIELCRENNILYWIGSMVESGISKILHVHIASLKDTYIPGDLAPSRRYFPKDIIKPEIIVKNGMIQVPTGCGLGVEIDENSLNGYTIDHIRIVGE
jgi:O-succinylbenzoate synthase